MAKTKAKLENTKYRGRKLIIGGEEVEFNEEGVCQCEPETAAQAKKLNGFHVIDSGKPKKDDKPKKEKTTRKPQAKKPKGEKPADPAPEEPAQEVKGEKTEEK